MLALTGVAAAVPALRAGRLQAVQAITAGQAPPAGRGYVPTAARQMPLPRPVTAGLAAPLSPRPLRGHPGHHHLGLTAVVLATGLGISLARSARAATVAARGGDPGGRPGTQQTFTPSHSRPWPPRWRTSPARPATRPWRPPRLPRGPPPFLGRQRARAGPACAHHRLSGRRRPARLGPHQRLLVHRPRPGDRQHRLPRHRRPDRGQAIHITVGGKTAATRSPARSTRRVASWGPCSPAGKRCTGRPDWPSTSTSSR